MQANVVLASQGNQICRKHPIWGPMYMFLVILRQPVWVVGFWFLSQFKIEWIENCIYEIGLEMMKILSQNLTERSTEAAKTV